MISVHFTKVLLPLLLLIPSTISYTYSQVRDPCTELEIRNRISLYPLALDRRDFIILEEVFAPNAIANYSSAGMILFGLRSIQGNLTQALDVAAASQHTISTTVVTQGPKHTIQSTAYLVANYLGQGANAGKLTQVIGRYEDTWEEFKGRWLIKYRVGYFFVSLIRRFVNRDYAGSYCRKGPGILGDPALLSDK